MLLAAGKSRRFGQDKRSYLLPGRGPLLISTIKIYQEVFDEVTVVLAANEFEIAETLCIGSSNKTLKCVFAKDAHLGMGHSLAAGIESVVDWNYAFIGLGDMPFISKTTLMPLKNKAGEDNIVVPTKDGRLGHPVGFPRTHFNELQTLRGDNGARQILENYKKSLTKIESDDVGIFSDIDRIEDIIK